MNTEQNHNKQQIKQSWNHFVVVDNIMQTVYQDENAMFNF